ncbi:uncharacterized protein EAF01_011253 [Botrytis porri]|uniref:RING-type domain-containing protein n=1 Tax=Botrytis porri TaxID=87229 RepID=A0A4Z1KYY8_9HELO|nr:uncharacterized protein EAF01_011253 [Botrytis porri]KAF7886575.1 hypothetical protein EAF01_011253 [Botrytis porri]TGO89762.1 hypothetical protein BPOR_0095g00230 [Botrytis porri]
MSDIERLNEALRRLDDLRRRNRPNHRRIHYLRHTPEARDVNISSRATAAPGARRFSFTSANETKWIRECRIVREVVYAGTQTLLRKELSALQRNQAETLEPGAATNDEATLFTGNSPQHRESFGSDTSQDTHINSLDWYFRKAFVDALLRPTQKLLKEIDPCFCSDPYAIETANGECHEAVKMPRCSHIFGRSCIAVWLQKKDTCPMCRQKVVILPLEG